MGRYGRADTIAAIWELGSSEAQWLAGIADSVARAFPDSEGQVAFLATSHPRYAVQAWAGDPEMLRLPVRASHDVEPNLLTSLYATVPASRRSRVAFSRYGPEWAPPALEEEFRGLGLADGIVISTAPSPRGHALIGIGIPRRRDGTISPKWDQRAAHWSAVAAHLDQAARVRAEVADVDECFAALSSIEEPAQADREEAAGPSTGSAETSSLWEALLRGHYSIVHRGSESGRLRCLLVENPPGELSLRALTPLERTLVERVCNGEGNKAIGAALRLQESSVANALRRAMRKIGIDRRAHLPRLKRGLSD